MNWIPESAERGVLGGESSQASDVFIAFHAFRWQRHRWVTRPHMATHDATEGAVHAHRIYCDCDRFNSLWELVGTSWLEKTVAMTRLTEPDLPKLPQMLSSEVVESVEFLASNMVEPG